MANRHTVWAIDPARLAAHQVDGQPFAEWAGELLAEDPEGGAGEALDEALLVEDRIVGQWRSEVFLDEFRDRIAPRLAAGGHAGLRDELLAYPGPGRLPADAPAVLRMLDDGELKLYRADELAPLLDATDAALIADPEWAAAEHAPSEGTGWRMFVDGVRALPSETLLVLSEP